MSDLFWTCVGVTLLIAMCVGIGATLNRHLPPNPRFVEADLTERTCVYDNVSGKFVACWLKKDGP